MASARQARDFKDYMVQLIETTMSDSSLQEAMDWIGTEFNPEDIFSEKQLAEWAESNGYTKE